MGQRSGKRTRGRSKCFKMWFARCQGKTRPNTSRSRRMQRGRRCCKHRKQEKYKASRTSLERLSSRSNLSPCSSTRLKLFSRGRTVVKCNLLERLIELSRNMYRSGSPPRSTANDGKLIRGNLRFHRQAESPWTHSCLQLTYVTPEVARRTSRNL